jgi:transcriptional regulator with XRE-family HTH domain
LELGGLKTGDVMSVKEPRAVDKYVGNRIKMRRLLLGISQDDLAHKVGVTFQQVQKYEKGINRISSGRLQEIAGALKVPIWFFFENAPESGSGRTNKEEQAIVQLSEFMASKEGVALNNAFPKIKNSKLRLSIVRLIEEIVANRTA